MALFGFLNVNKPAGITSRDVVNQVQRLVKPAKAGHAGTLDPLATGVLVVALGPATRLIEYVQGMRKRYRGTFLLGRSSDTEDVDGTVTELADPPIPTLAELQAAAASLTGEIMQRPPAYSAIKVAGKRAYDRARAGESVVLEARPVQVYQLAVVEYDYPRLVLDVECGSGTYVRTLGRELAEQCGTSAVMSDLVRTAIGEFRLEESVEPASLTKGTIGEHLLPATLALRHLPAIQVSAEEQVRLNNGVAIDGRDEVAMADECHAINADGRLVAILSRQQNVLKPTRVFPVEGSANDGKVG